MYDMINIFEVFLPQLLRYPNPSDPLNGEAAALLLRDPKNYDVKVKGRLENEFCLPASVSAECKGYIGGPRSLILGFSSPDYVQRYATKNAADEAGAESEDDDDLSSVGSFDDDDEEAQPAGQMDDV